MLRMKESVVVKSDDVFSFARYKIQRRYTDFKNMHANIKHKLHPDLGVHIPESYPSLFS